MELRAERGLCFGDCHADADGAVAFSRKLRRDRISWAWRRRILLAGAEREDESER
jgi:hypothetical protein